MRKITETATKNFFENTNYINKNANIYIDNTYINNTNTFNTTYTLYETTIAILTTNNHLILNAWTHETATTKDKLNWILEKLTAYAPYLQHTYKIQQIKWNWYIIKTDKQNNEIETIIFKNLFTINLNNK